MSCAAAFSYIGLAHKHDDGTDGGNEDHADAQDFPGNARREFGADVGARHEADDDLGKEKEIEVSLEKVAKAAEDSNGHDDHHSRSDGQRQGQAEEDEQDELNKGRGTDAKGTGKTAHHKAGWSGCQYKAPSRLQLGCTRIGEGTGMGMIEAKIHEYG